jgi:hypothetical protein
MATGSLHPLKITRTTWGHRAIAALVPWRNGLGEGGGEVAKQAGLEIELAIAAHVLVRIECSPTALPPEARWRPHLSCLCALTPELLRNAIRAE